MWHATAERKSHQACVMGGMEHLIGDHYINSLFSLAYWQL
jgi:hypothetical protein